MIQHDEYDTSRKIWIRSHTTEHTGTKRKGFSRLRKRIRRTMRYEWTIEKFFKCKLDSATEQSILISLP
mgnify:CR=1 FL=1